MIKTKWSDYGESSLTLLAVHCGMDKERPSIPYDPVDFQRCVHLIKCLNLNLKQERNLLHTTMKIYPIWKPFVESWGRLMALYIEEKDCETAPKLYDHLKKCRGKLS